MNNTNVEELIKKHQSIKLDIGCGGNKQKDFIGMDARDLEDVDIIHDLQKFPYPLPDGVCSVVLGSHIIEHIKPEFTIPMFDELWRLLRVGGQAVLSTPYAGSPGFWQDPTHCNGFNEATFQYFDPRFPLWEIYKPKPWEIQSGFPQWQANGNLQCILEKVTEKQGKLKREERLKDANV